MLYEFVSSNHHELARRCRSKVSERASPPLAPAGLEHGVPLVLEQLVWALRAAEESPASQHANPASARKTPAAVEVSRTAALHGKELREQGYTAGQVAQDYADISQAVTELAMERHVPVTAEEFHSLDRFLDSAIADAIASYGNLTRSRELFAKP